MLYFLIVSRLFFYPCIRKKEPNLTKKWLEETVMGHGSIGLHHARCFLREGGIGRQKLLFFCNKAAKRQQNKSKKAAKEQPSGSKTIEPNWSKNKVKIFIPGSFLFL